MPAEPANVQVGQPQPQTQPEPPEAEPEPEEEARCTWPARWSCTVGLLEKKSIYLG